MLWAFLVGFVALFGGCNKKPPVVTASNEQFNMFYKNNEHISPIGNIIADRQDPELLKRNYRYFESKYYASRKDYDDDQAHMLFLVKNSDVNQIKNVSVESIPQNNRDYIINIAEYEDYKDINRRKYLEIEHAVFVNDAKLAKQYRESKGDPIIHPYTYTDIASEKMRIVIGDEYIGWSSICETHDLC